MTDDRCYPLAAPTVPASPQAEGAGRRAVPVAMDAAVAIGSVRFRELRAVARVQRRAFEPRLAYRLPTLLALWALPNVRFLVARREGAVLGCIIGDRQGGQARVITLAVEPAARRRGIGRALLGAMEAALPTGDLLLMGEEENAPARALYDATGYAQVGVARDYYGRGRHGLWMQKRRRGGEGGSRKERT